MLFRQPPFLAAAIMASTLAGCLAVSVVLAPTPVTLATGIPGGIYHASFMKHEFQLVPPVLHLMLRYTSTSSIKYCTRRYSQSCPWSR